jgi:hypothetical protein
MFRKYNPLHPDAWLTEPHPFDVPGEKADIRLGVHTTDNFDTALAYAVHKASQTGDLQNLDPNCGIILELNMTGLDPLPEADAIIVAKYESVVIAKLRRELQPFIDEENPDGLTDEFYAFMELVESSGRDKEQHLFWFEAFWEGHIREEGPWVILGPLTRIAEENPNEFFEVMYDAFETNQFPQELWAEAIGQYRYMVPVGFDRLLKIYAVQPVNPNLEEEDYIEEDEGPVSMTFFEVEAPDTQLLWDSGKQRAKVLEYHGTDVTRARLSFPEVANEIYCPWSYGQPEGVGPI